jgi:hypothetical protein
MDTATARVDAETLDLIQVATAPVPIERFRLLLDCPTCQRFADEPPTPQSNADLRDHIRTDHAHLVLAESD